MASSEEKNEDLTDENKNDSDNKDITEAESSENDARETETESSDSDSAENKNEEDLKKREEELEKLRAELKKRQEREFKKHQKREICRQKQEKRLKAVKTVTDKVYVRGANAGELLFNAFVTIVKYIVYAVLYTIAAILRGIDHIKKKYSRRFFRNLGEKLAAPFKRYHKAYKLGTAEISRESEKSAGAGFAARIRVMGRALFGKRGILVTICNYAMPIAACGFLFHVVAFATSQTFAIKLTVNGSFIGYIADETVFTEAEQMLQKRINYTGASTDAVVFIPSYEVDHAGYGSTLSTYQVTDQMLRLMDKQIDYGFGLYIGDAYYGTLTNYESVQYALDTLLAKYRTDNPNEQVIFEKDVTFVPGLYLEESFMDERRIIDMLTSYKTVVTSYSASAGDTAETVCSKTKMSMSELLSLNEGINDKTKFSEGDKVMIHQDQPFLNIIITREEHYDEEIKYSTRYTSTDDRYEGFRMITTVGQNGMSAVVADVSYINGVEVGRRVLSRITTKSPVTEVIAVGTKPIPELAAPPSTVEEGMLIWPLGGDGGVKGYGWGEYPGHRGQDILADLGTPIFAADSGVITRADYGAGWNGGYGNLVVIRHNNGRETYYAHCSMLAADTYVGKRVTAGELIAFVGSTGDSSTNHLHIELKINGDKVDPEPYLPDHASVGWRYR